jgi:hypothetical protein
MPRSMTAATASCSDRPSLRTARKPNASASNCWRCASADASRPRGFATPSVCCCVTVPGSHCRQTCTIWPQWPSTTCLGSCASTNRRSPSGRLARVSFATTMSPCNVSAATSPPMTRITTGGAIRRRRCSRSKLSRTVRACRPLPSARFIASSRTCCEWHSTATMPGAAMVSASTSSQRAVPHARAKKIVSSHRMVHSQRTGPTAGLLQLV